MDTRVFAIMHTTSLSTVYPNVKDAAESIRMYTAKNTVSCNAVIRVSEVISTVLRVRGAFSLLTKFPLGRVNLSMSH